jgi:hypothetical protein
MALTINRDHRVITNGFLPVTERHERMVVLASGPSGAGVREHPGVPVIAVNGAITGLSWTPDYWFTLDPSPINQTRLQNRREGCKYFVAVDRDVGPKASNPNMRADFTDCHLLQRRFARGASTHPSVIHVGNSGRGAIQLAMLMGATRIAVLGVDGTDDPYWYGGGKPGNLKHLPTQCVEMATPGVDIRFATTGQSRIHGFPLLSPAELLAWIHT